MPEQHVYEARQGWLKCESIGKKQELEDIIKSKEDYLRKIQNLDRREAVIQYTLQKIDQELKELQNLIQS